MINKLISISLVFLGVFTVFATAQSCGHGAQVKFVSPPSSSKIWVKNFVVWPDLPIRVRAKGQMWEMLTKDADRAITFWNEKIGCKVFEPSWKAGAEVQISMAAQPEGSNWAGSHKHVARMDKHGDKYWGSRIYIHVLYLNDQTSRDNVMRHELGHVLGLDDLEVNEDLLMHKYKTEGMGVPSEALSTLNNIYCGEE